MHNENGAVLTHYTVGSYNHQYEPPIFSKNYGDVLNLLLTSLNLTSSSSFTFSSAPACRSIIQIIEFVEICSSMIPRKHSNKSILLQPNVKHKNKAQIVLIISL